MRVRIEYCNSWGYLPRASRLEDKIRGEFPEAEVELLESWGGVFEVSCDEELIFSKRRTGRFPEWDEIRAKLQEGD